MGSTPRQVNKKNPGIKKLLNGDVFKTSLGNIIGLPLGAYINAAPHTRAVRPSSICSAISTYSIKGFLNSNEEGLAITGILYSKDESRYERMQ